MAPGANIGFDTAIFEAVHGSAPDIAGMNLANPCAVILAGAMMLRHIGEEKAAKNIDSAIATVLYEGKTVTRDINSKSNVGTNQMADAIISKLK